MVFPEYSYIDPFFPSFSQLLLTSDYPFLYEKQNVAFFSHNLNIKPEKVKGMKACFFFFPHFSPPV